jgi:hypothetical protein
MVCVIPFATKRACSVEIDAMSEEVHASGIPVVLFVQTTEPLAMLTLPKI